MKVLNMFFFVIPILFIISCEFPDCSNVPDVYYDLYDDTVTHYVELNKNATFLHYYEKEGKKYSHTGKWKIHDDGCVVELDNWIIYSEKEIENIGGFGGLKFGSLMGNKLFWPYENSLEENPDTYLKGFTRKSYIKTFKKLLEKARIKDSLYWADTDTLYYKTGEIKEIGKKVIPYGDNEIPRKKGPWREFYKSGSLKGEGDSNPSKNYIWRYFYESGELKSVGNYEGGMKVGPWEYYYKNGVVKEKGIYIYTYNDSLQFEKKRGRWKYYNSKGQFIRVKKYKSVEKSLDSLYNTRDWNGVDVDLVKHAKETKERWCTPMKEYKKGLRIQDSIEKLKSN